jgi:hypothetical protein
MSDSDSDESTIPSRDECETRCQKFAEITGKHKVLMSKGGDNSCKEKTIYKTVKKNT